MDSTELQHHGVKGQKWGLRRYQNRDGSLTPAGRKHNGIKSSRSDGKAETVKKKASAKKPKELSPRQAMRAKKKAIKAKVRAEAQKAEERETLSNYENKQRVKYLGKERIEEKKKSSDDKRANTDISHLSNSELRTVVERMELEKRYSALTAPEVVKKEKKGQSFIKKELGVVADIAVRELTTAAVKSYAKKTFGVDTSSNDKKKNNS